MTRGARSHRDDVDQVVERVEVVGVARVEPRRMRMCSGRDQKVHRPCSGLTSRVDEGCRYLAVACCHGFIHRQRVERALKHQQTSQPLGAHLSLRCDENPEVEFGECDCADGKRAA